MAAIEIGVEISECQITPKVYAADTTHPWVNVELNHERDGRGVGLNLNFANADEIDRLTYALEQARSWFDRTPSDRALVPACEVEVV